MSNRDDDRDLALLPDDDEDGQEEIDPAFYANGGIIFNEDELGALGELTGLRVLHLTWGCSEESPSLANMGAIVTEVGDDGTTAGLATAAGLSIEFVEDDPGGLSMAFRESRAFDVVYSGYGALDWVTDFDDWASGIADVLVPGGKLVIYDEHPFSYVFDSDERGRLTVTNSYFGDYGDDSGGEFDDEDEDDDLDEDDAPEPVIEREGPFTIVDNTVDEDDEEEDPGDQGDQGWTLGDLFGALGTHGLVVKDLQEFRTSERYETPLDRLVGEVDGFDLDRVPSALLVVAVKPG
ncbi:MAG: class I SAM-dependent methyltransferase [Dehalococcoidia bacterium]